MSLSPEDISANFDKFRSLCEKLGDRSEIALAMVDKLGEQLALCPASSRKDYHNCMPGGLAEHSLRVLSNAMKLVKSFGWTVPKDSLIISCLFHDIGKVGLANDDGTVSDYYIPQESDWHREKLGELYKYNKEMQYMSTPQRSVHMCQQFGLKLKTDEYLSILLNDGFVLDENKPYCLKTNPLVFVVMTADYISTMQEKFGGVWTP
jgi:HD domain